VDAAREGDSVPAMPSTLRWGILGTGWIAGIFAAALAKTRTGRLQAVASRQLERAKAFAGRHGGATAHGSPHALWADKAVDAVYIATPHTNHHAETLAALAAGKHVLVEKPMATSAAHAHEMAEAAARAKRVLLEAFMYRLHPQTARLQQVLASGEIGQVRVVRSSFCFGLGDGYNVRLDRALHGGALFDVGCYCINACRMVAGEEPVGISAQAYVERPHGVDAHTAGALRFPSGVVATFDVGIRSANSSHLEILGARGRIVVPNPWKPSETESRFSVEGPKGGREEIIANGGDIYALEADHLAHVAETGADSPISAASGIGNVRVLETMHRQIHG
jgi:xylose dehydrogenase (NAD/NADP)